MENIQIISTCPWISDQIDLKNYFSSYHSLLDEANGSRKHHEKINAVEALKEFFQSPDDLGEDYMKLNRPVTDSKESKQKKVANSNVELPNNDSPIDLFSLNEMEKNCSVDLLTVEEELPPRAMCQPNSDEFNKGRITNWYAGSFTDGLIPEDGRKALQTLAVQDKELYRRETVRDYARLRQRFLKYHSTIRMILKESENIPDDTNANESCMRDTLINIRIQRPYYKKALNVKSLNKFPGLSQELLMLGSQNLCELKDAIVCINDHYVHKDLSETPDLVYAEGLPSSKDLFPASHFFISGCFYYDDGADIDLSETVRNWGKKTDNIGPMESKVMKTTKLEDLKIRLGYPYLYQHLGNCEHLITFTDVRLVHRNDAQDPCRYPLLRGTPVQVTLSCFICNVCKASWLVKGHPKFDSPMTHLCDSCLKHFCYDEHMEKRDPFSLYLYSDEATAFKKLAENRKDKKRLAPKEIRLNVGDSTVLSLDSVAESSGKENKLVKKEIHTDEGDSNVIYIKSDVGSSIEENELAK